MASVDLYDGQLLTIKDHIIHLRKWLREQQPILNSLDTDEFLLRFLRVTDFRIAHAKERLIRFWQYRTENLQWFTNRDLLKSPLMCEIGQLVYCLQLPKATKDKHLIFLMRMGRYNPTQYTFDDVTRYAFAVADILNSQPAAQLYGFIILLDFTSIRLKHISQFTLDRIRRYIDCWEKMYPIHVRQIHVYNYPTCLSPLFHFLRMFYRGEFHDRIYFHSRSSDDSMRKSLHMYIDPSLLPVEYGGQLGSVESEMNQSFRQWTQERNDSMILLEQYGVDLEHITQLLTNVRKECNL
ncbi:unnamed protein product [Adineta ricciae]|uniref:CRAL-TRIO domain-containing protein n=1 Tax=Adineta ricciae TaxID=249248 RepID=A0A815XU30_ADIRI|nr:unnamed protein product [Adineta ricciae]